MSLEQLQAELASISIHEGDPDANRARALARALEDAARALESMNASEAHQADAREFVRTVATVIAGLAASNREERASRRREKLMDLCRSSSRILRGHTRSPLWAEQGTEAIETSAGVVEDKFRSLEPDAPEFTEEQRSALKLLLRSMTENRGRLRFNNIPVPTATEALFDAMGWPANVGTATRTARRRRSRSAPG